MAEDKKDDDSYKGPGKFTALVGRGAVEAVVAGIGASAVGAVAGAAVARGNRKVGALVGAEIGTALGQVTGFIHGAIVGAHNVDAAEEQVKKLVEQRDVALGEGDVQKKFVKLLIDQKEANKESGQRRT